ncbi:ABC transporter permease/substrate-binding protein [Bacillaceae bacterium SIJ1]|uniref:ABC transporter permease/substrate-binding protein n=1 Tax=Litoribacterium kuwaitense TaxID=1398745 RepID=UPI0013ED4EB2|nr:ABC transporter permease/substrate-binding protein [Litoribacterium kuwaitense]NGP44019.1 ABC transporter permease/substrate-binding protein [Litoribacterium kuwaitense]
MNDFFAGIRDVYFSRQDQFWLSLWEHLQISVISLLFAIVIGVPLGILLTRRTSIAEPIIAVAAIIQTIPSLAVLAFLIPLVGIGKQPAIIALVAYGLLPILRNTYTGIKEVDPSLIEAAKGFGMNSMRRLLKVEFPLSIPVILAGIRTSMVLIVGTTTIAALIGAGGLGDLILLGIDRGADPYLILLGAVPAALLAILLDIIFRSIERSKSTRSITPFVSVLVALVLIVTVPLGWTAATQGSSSKEKIVAAAKLGAEPTILIHMYKLLIEQDTDLEVELKPGFGKTELVFTALQSGEVDVYPEFTGTAIVTHLEEKAVSTNREEVYEQAKKGMAEKYNMVYLAPMSFNNTYSLAMKRSLAEEKGLETISDLATVAPSLTAGFTLEFADRGDGYLGIQELYGFQFSAVETMEPGIRENAIRKGEVDVIDAYSTSSSMIKLDLVALEDNQKLFPPYQGAPLLRQETVDRYPEVAESLNKLGGQITDEEMQSMNYRVEVEGESAEGVAREYLLEAQLLKEAGSL